MKSFKLLFASVFTLFASITTFAQDTAAMSIDEKINNAIAPIINPFVSAIFSPLPGSEALFGTAFPWIVLWLVVAASIFTIYFGFIQFRGFKHSIELVRGD